MNTYEFSAPIQKVPGLDGAYVEVPYDLPSVFGAGRIKVHASFDGHPYDGSIVSSKFEDDPDTKHYIIGIKKHIRAAINKQPGDTVTVAFTCAQIDGAAQIYYDALLAKVTKKGRDASELATVINWLLGYTEAQLQDPALLALPFWSWLEDAPAYNPAANLVSGKVCGIAVAEVQDPTMRRMRILDKLVDELAKGKPLEKILRSLRRHCLWYRRWWRCCKCLWFADVAICGSRLCTGCSPLV